MYRLQQENTMESIDERIAQLEEQLQQERSKKQSLMARRRTARKAMADNTRRQLLVGAAVLAHVDAGAWSRDTLLAILDIRLMQSEDRAMFDLPPLHIPKKPQPEEFDKNHDTN